MDRVKRMTNFLIQMAGDRYKAYEAKKKKESSRESENNHDNEFQDKVNLLVLGLEARSLQDTK